MELRNHTGKAVRSGGETRLKKEVIGVQGQVVQDYGRTVHKK